MIDQYGRKIDYLRVSVTDRCNLRCIYCMSEEGVPKKSHSGILRNEELLMILKQAAELGIRKIRITGGEPLVRKGIIELTKEIAQIEGIEEVAMTTNGLLLPQHIKALKTAGLKRLNISLDTLRPERFKEITRFGGLDKVMEGIRMAIDLGMTPVKINTVLIGGFNDDEINDFVKLTEHQPIDVRFIELMPIGEARHWAQQRFASNAMVLERVPQLEPIESTDLSSPATYYQLPGGKGRVGLISPISCQFCGNCNRIRLTADGKLKPCLHSEDELDLLEFVKEAPDEIRAQLLEAVNMKPEAHRLETEDGVLKSRNMNQIGG